VTAPKIASVVPTAIGARPGGHFPRSGRGPPSTPIKSVPDQ
jgi:hypothetical protein